MLEQDQRNVSEEVSLNLHNIWGAAILPSMHNLVSTFIEMQSDETTQQLEDPVKQP
jgi:hypothetical protein